ncbi:hypothetical protein NX059_001355 [Plenodomus lindquistii]|nr:hypothetical protein NX059_001355 [Plenodomus lindquistii]
MPRSLARLRYRAVPRPARLARVRDLQRMDLRVARYVKQQSTPQPFRLQTVVNASAKRQPTGAHVSKPWMPYTLRDVVDPEKQAKHGEVIYVFRNAKTNQIIYSLQELLDDHHLDQLPFIGKHSKPPVLRPDEWQPHCVITFPTAHQGYSAFRRLRELRKLHELAWEKTNPEWKQLNLKARVKKIMDQRANFSADLAEVLRMQEEYGAKTQQEREELDRQAEQFLEKRWSKIDQMAKAAKEKEKDADNIHWLEGQIRSMKRKLHMKHNQDEASQKSLKATKEALETRLRRVKFAVAKANQLKDKQRDLATRAAPAIEEGAEAKLSDLRSQAQVLEDALADLGSIRKREDIAADRRLLAQHQADIAALEEAFQAKAELEVGEEAARNTILPKHFTSKTRTPIYTLTGVDVSWADLQDALYAKGQWPETIEHGTLDINAGRTDVAYLSKEEYDVVLDNERRRIMEPFEEQARLHEEQRQARWEEMIRVWKEKRRLRQEERARNPVVRKPKPKTNTKKKVDILTAVRMMVKEEKRNAGVEKVTA